MRAANIVPLATVLLAPASTAAQSSGAADTPTPNPRPSSSAIGAGEENLQPEPHPGNVHFAAGVLGVLPPLSRGTTPTPGLDLNVHYETGNRRFEVGGYIRFGLTDSASSTTTVVKSFFTLSAGGRYYPSEGAFSPYVGAGLAWSYWKLSLPDFFFDDNGSGPGACAEAGVEMLRTQHTHIALGARLDLPFFSMGDTVGEPLGRAPTIYYAPLSLEIRLTL